MIERLCYVYGVVPASIKAATAPKGIERGEVTLIPSGEYAALATSVSAEDYAPARVEALTADVDWVSERARAHDRVLTWASANGPAVPFPMRPLCRDSNRVNASLTG